MSHTVSDIRFDSKLIHETYDRLRAPESPDLDQINVHLSAATVYENSRTFIKGVARRRVLANTNTGCYGELEQRPEADIVLFIGSCLLRKEVGLTKHDVSDVLSHELRHIAELGIGLTGIMPKPNIEHAQTKKLQSRLKLGYNKTSTTILKNILLSAGAVTALELLGLDNYGIVDSIPDQLEWITYFTAIDTFTSRKSRKKSRVNAMDALYDLYRDDEVEHSAHEAGESSMDSGLVQIITRKPIGNTRSETSPLYVSRNTKFSVVDGVSNKAMRALHRSLSFRPPQKLT